MRSISATFKAQAIVDDKLAEVPVYMETDGKTVAVSTAPMYWGARTEGKSAPMLTPQGWAQVGTLAYKLTQEANEAWQRMGAEE